jgi:hypothetical protein
MDMNTIKNPADMQALPMSEKAKLATMLGEQVGKVLDKALVKCNKMLKKYGYTVSLTLNFHEIDSEDKSI